MGTNSILWWFGDNLPFTRIKEYKEIISKLNVKSVLDVGCGYGTNKSFKKYSSFGIDINKECVEKAKQGGNYKHIFFGDITELQLKDNSFDAVVCIQTIEHLTKENGYVLLDKMESLAEKLVIVITPFGYFPIPEHDRPYMKHLSGWYPNDFIKRGYDITYTKYFRWRASYNNWTLMFGYLFTLLLQPLIRKHPQKYAQDIIAIKRKEE